MMIQYSFPRSVVQGFIAVLMIAAGAWLASLVPGIDLYGTKTETSAETAEVLPPPAGHVRVVVDGVRYATGKIIIIEFDDANAWNTQNFEAATSYHAFDAKAGRMILDIPVEGDKPRAWSLFHDENEDNDLNIDGGYPLEAFGASGAYSALDEPDFDAASKDGNIVMTKLFYPY